MALLVPDILSAATGAIAGIAGAFIGAWAAKTRHRNEYLFRTRNALRAIMLEITQNQSGLLLDLDRALPAYIARIHNTSAAGVAAVAEVQGQARSYPTTVYDALLSEALASEFGSELMTYYARLGWLNSRTRPGGKLEIELEFGRYMLQLANAILAADDLVPALDRETRKSGVKQWGRNRDVEAFMDMRDSYLVAANVTKHKLKVLDKFATDGEYPPGFPDILVQNRGRVANYVDAAKKA